MKPLILINIIKQTVVEKKMSTLEILIYFAHKVFDKKHINKIYVKRAWSFNLDENIIDIK
jgi:hypothetical protein